MKPVALAIFAFAVSACGGSVPEKTDTGVQVSANGGTAEVQEITLGDGTRCAVMVGSYKAAISCDWKRNN